MSRASTDGASSGIDSGPALISCGFADDAFFILIPVGLSRPDLH
jgi:hypothetical protein